MPNFSSKSKNGFLRLAVQELTPVRQSFWCRPYCPDVDSCCGGNLTGYLRLAQGGVGHPPYPIPKAPFPLYIAVEIVLGLSLGDFATTSIRWQLYNVFYHELALKSIGVIYGNSTTALGTLGDDFTFHLVWCVDTCFLY